MSEQRQRYSELYFGQNAATFTILGEFEMQPTRLRFNFETWSSVESFESGAKPIARLKKEFTLDGDDLETLRSENRDMFVSIEDSALNIANVGGRGYKLNRLYLSTIVKFLTVEANSENQNDRPTANKYSDDYDALIQENLQLIIQVITLTWTYGKQNDLFLNQNAASELFSNIKNIKK